MITCKHEKGLRFSIDIRGFKVYTDVRMEKGGDDSAPEPPELMHSALLTCMGTYFLFFCRQHEIDPAGFEISVTWEMEDAPARFGRYTINFKFPPDFPEKKKNAAKAYMRACPVGNTLEKGCEVVQNFV